MRVHISKKEARNFKKRWLRVNREEIRELRRTPIMTKLKQLASLMFSVEELGWKKMLGSGESEVRKRWNRLRKLGHA